MKSPTNQLRMNSSLGALRCGRSHEATIVQPAPIENGLEAFDLEREAVAQIAPVRNDPPDNRALRVGL